MLFCKHGAFVGCLDIVQDRELLNSPFLVKFSFIEQFLKYRTKTMRLAALMLAMRLETLQ